ncbi:sulfide:quinone oxidoreductase, mitochondrial [Neodiprion lecontei]|uniref:Sulfide:quinone oxidoreductase, mitochondrial n=1 Tax=Neodiprion lecontei TaxID=441921 RepID=A0A6J0CC58_NEOLC|nr:sulfide:quinone oxidoreductase, mitochondrial [Neodiprion lecontei]XP_015524957.1 sulfide:quinone oxidoreductase, mitochondrial [Neodiprion lecontei]XP_046595999.1 sulfide:quinone oxidoreductase, mitochondrial [Neodiprion lecontei]XP_046596000.1 sulfide:quinone oxidoreductase, mitochondrial [Neodiprion lecontei]
MRTSHDMFRTSRHCAFLSSRQFNNENVILRNAHHSCKILVVGGGTAGCTMAAKFSNKFKGSKDTVVIVEPSERHYYQPMFTLIGGGVKTLESSYKSMEKVLPKDAQWIKDRVVKFEPESNTVTVANGDSIQYEYLIVALGLQLYWNKIPGLSEALEDPKVPVCSIYGPETVGKVFRTIENTKSGSAYFTFPNSPVKCPGAPQKIVYLAEEYWHNKRKLQDIHVTYNTALPVIFGVKKYADALWKVCQSRNISVNLQTNLIEIRTSKNEAVFQNLQNPDELNTVKYSMLHVTPPMGPPELLKNHSALTNEAGFLSVDPQTLRHDKYSNIFGLGDCTNTPNSKTMAAIAAQSKVVYEHLSADLSGKVSKETYNGYASCPLVTGYGKCILAEFDYKLQPTETFPINQAKEYFAMYLLKKYFFPYLYWNWMLKGHWNGPAIFRKYLNCFSRKEVAPISKTQ